MNRARAGAWNPNCDWCSGRDLAADCGCIEKCGYRFCEGTAPAGSIDKMTDGG